MTAEEFRRHTGRLPEADDLDRVNCDSTGQPGHLQCGWCAPCNAPKFECLCDWCKGCDNPKCECMCEDRQNYFERLLSGWPRQDVLARFYGEWGPEQDEEAALDPGEPVWQRYWMGEGRTEVDTVYATVLEGRLRLVHRWWCSAYGYRHDRDLWRVAVVISDAAEVRQVLDAVPAHFARRLAAQL